MESKLQIRGQASNQEDQQNGNSSEVAGIKVEAL